MGISAARVPIAITAISVITGVLIAVGHRARPETTAPSPVVREAPPMPPPPPPPPPPPLHRLDAAAWVAALPIGPGRASDTATPDEDFEAEQLGEDCYVAHWSRDGLATSTERTDFDAYTVGKRTEIHVAARHATGFDEVRAALVRRLGQPKVKTDLRSGQVLTWRRPVKVTVQHRDDDIDVVIGGGLGPCR